MAIPRDEHKGMSLPSLLLCVFLVGGALLLKGGETARASIVQTTITVSICGNGLVDYGEICDDGVSNNTAGYGSTTAQRICGPDCQSFGPYCGDGVLQVRFDEQCDSGSANGVIGSLCTATCIPIPAVPATIPPRVLGGTPSLPATPGAIPSTIQTQVVLRGKAYPNADISILLDGKQFGTARADTNADFLFNSTAVTPGTATFSFLAKDSAGVSSLTTSVVFEVVQSAITSVNNVYIAPTLSVDQPKVSPGTPLTLFGQSVPRAKVITSIDTDTSDALAAEADASGKWSFQLSTGSVTNGFHTAKALFIFSTTSRSGYGKSVNFFVGDELPKGGLLPDLNGDKKVNLVDFSIFLLSWNSKDVRSDFNQDGTVNLADFSIMLFNWTG